MIKWIKTNMPDIYKFFKDFISALNNKKEGMSLKKLLSIGYFWLCVVCVFKYTDKDNVEAVLVILTSTVTALVITNSVAVLKTNKLDKELEASDEQK